MGAVYCKEDSQINPLNTTLAFAHHAQKQGACIIRNTSVEDIEIKKGEIRAVKTEKGKIAAEKVINTAGAWAPKISKMAGIDIPIKPRRGQLLVSEEMPELIKGTLLDAKYITSKYSTNPENKEGEMGVGLSLTQTQAGNLLIGGCRQFSGYNKSTSYYAFQAIMKNAVKMIPFLKEINIIRSFAGLRPYTPDGKPILGKVPGIKGLYIAAGHEGDGIALAPVTGKIISQIIAGEATGIKPEIFKENLSLKRFIS
uniref:FAD dependent oxidoreductase n=1 Tax=uncultured organism TaxID=155900 RepID=M1PQF3_9ZZZZ|nr:FAD dependent oxidoreductase [uncultured organism]